MPESLRIAHCADIHLDGEVAGIRAVDFYRDAFARTLLAMQAHEPRMMLLAGDLFDANSATEGTIRWAMEMLAGQPFPVILIPGNHDCMVEDAIYRRYDFNRIPNVHMLAAEAGETVRIAELDTAVWGKGMVEHSRAYSPLGGCPDRPAGCTWFLGMGHGMLVPHGEQALRSSPIHMHEIEASACDYLALGHHHAALELLTEKATAAYSGSPTDTLGRGQTYVIVDLAARTSPSVAVHTLAKEA